MKKNKRNIMYEFLPIFPRTLNLLVLVWPYIFRFKMNNSISLSYSVVLATTWNNFHVSQQGYITRTFSLRKSSLCFLTGLSKPITTRIGLNAII